MTGEPEVDPVRGVRRERNCSVATSGAEESGIYTPVAAMGSRMLLLLSIILLCLSWSRGAIITGVRGTFHLVWLLFFLLFIISCD